MSKPAHLLLACVLLTACSHDLDIFVDRGTGLDTTTDSPLTDTLTDSGAPDHIADLSCTAPLIPCGGACVDPTSDDKHCGGCDAPCPANTSCKSSACDCLAGYEDCDTDTQTGCEAHLATDVDNCGKCNKSCTTGQICRKGKCVCDPVGVGACGPADYCSASHATCQSCDKYRLNCDLTGNCECVGKCSGTACDNTCTYGIPGQCGSVYHACKSNGTCAPCPSGLKNCDQQSGCGTPEGDPC